MKRILSFAMLMALVLAVPTFAANASKSSSSSGTGEIGFGIGQADVSSDATGIDSQTFLGIRGGYNFNPQFQLEGQLSSASESIDEAGLTADTTTRLLMVNGVMNFHPSKKELVPYVMAGIGRADVSVDPSVGSSVSDDSVAYQVGGGTRVFFGKTQRMAFRADVSWLKANNFDDSATSTTVTAGLTWKLGSH